MRCEEGYGVITIAITILVLGIDIPKDYWLSEAGSMHFLLKIGHDMGPSETPPEP